MFNGITRSFVTPSFSRIEQHAEKVRTEIYLRPLTYGLYSLSINACFHFLYEILSKSDVKYTKYELNIIYVRKYRAAVTKPPLTKLCPVQPQQLDISTDFSPNRMKKYKKLGNISWKYAFHCTDIYDTQILLNVIMCTSPFIQSFIHSWF